MITLTYILIYLVGVVASYFVGRYMLKETTGRYTKSRRNIVLFVSIFSYIGVVSGFIALLVNSNSTDEASW